MARLISVSLNSATSTAPIPLNTNITPVNISLAVELSPGAVLTYTVEHTYDPIATTNDLQNLVWFPFLSNQTTNNDGYYAFPVVAVRLIISAYSSGTATLRILQAGI